MAIPKIKATYSLDAETVKLLERTSRRWGVSKSEALRRAIHAAAEAPVPVDDRREALAALRASLALTREQADAWVAEVRAERRASSRKRLSRLGPG